MKKKSLSATKKNLKSSLKILNNQKILKIYKSFKNSLFLEKKFAVAVSGGPDSMSLAFLSKCFAIKNNLDVKFYLVDHKLRKDSKLEAKIVTSKLKKFGIICKKLSWKGKKPRKNIQAVARNKRYSLLTEQCKKDNIQYLLLGHHIDDLYENFLIRLLRGSGLKGLTSFGVESEYKKNGVNILRPLMNIDKESLIFLSNKVFNFFINDPSNLNIDFKRIRIRNLIANLKKEGLDKNKLNLTIQNLKESDKSINFYVQKNLEKNSKFLKFRRSYFLNKSFFNQSDEVIFRSLSFILKLIGGRDYAPRAKSIDLVISGIRFNKKFKKVTLGGCFIEKINETILISRENSSKNPKL